MHNNVNALAIMSFRLGSFFLLLRHPSSVPRHYLKAFDFVSSYTIPEYTILFNLKFLSDLWPNIRPSALGVPSPKRPTNAARARISKMV